MGVTKPHCAISKGYLWEFELKFAERMDVAASLDLKKSAIGKMRKGVGLDGTVSKKSL